MSGNTSKMLLSDILHRGLNITKHKFNIFIRSDKCCLRTARIACRGDLWQKSVLPRKSCNADSTCFAFWSLSHQYLEEQINALDHKFLEKEFLDQHLKKLTLSQLSWNMSLVMNALGWLCWITGKVIAPLSTISKSCKSCITMLSSTRLWKTATTRPVLITPASHKTNMQLPTVKCKSTFAKQLEVSD